MATHTVKMTIHASRGLDGKYTYWLFLGDMSSCGYIPVMDHEVTFEIPDNFNPVPAEIEMLKKAKEAIQAEAFKRTAQIDDQISKLLCLEYKPEAEVV